MGSDYSHLRTVSYKGRRDIPNTVFLERGPDGHVYLKDGGHYYSISTSPRKIVNATDFELTQMLAPFLGLPTTSYQNGKRHWGKGN